MRLSCCKKKNHVYAYIPLCMLHWDAECSGRTDCCCVLITDFWYWWILGRSIWQCIDICHKRSEKKKRNLIITGFWLSFLTFTLKRMVKESVVRLKALSPTVFTHWQCCHRCPYLENITPYHVRHFAISLVSNWISEGEQILDASFMFMVQESNQDAKLFKFLPL